MVKKEIDCLFIGHNEMSFEAYERTVRKMGVNSGAYRDLNLNFVRYNNKPCSAAEIFNLFYCRSGGSPTIKEPLRPTEVFSPAIAYLGSYLQCRGLTFDYVNSFQFEKEELAEKLSRGNILTIVVTTTLYVSVLPILEIMDFIRRYNAAAKIILGGPFVATQARVQEPRALAFLFESIGADFYVVSSQGEATLVKIIGALKDDLPFDQIDNIYYNSANKYVSTPVLREDNKLSENMVDWDLFPGRVGRMVNVRTAISCPFNCAFCGFHKDAGKYQPAEVEAVERELAQLNQMDSVACVQFIDDTFNVPVRRFKDILKMMIKNKYRFRWHSHFRCQYADRETVELMKESGCEGVFLGIESGNDRILKNMNKAAAVEQYMNGIALLKAYEIVTYGSFIIGFPGETRRSVADTIRFITESGLDFYRAQSWYCDPNSPIWQQREQHKIEGESFGWSHATMDSKEGADLVDEIFLSIEEPVWIPQYNFEFDALFQLLHRGLSWAQIVRFIRGFNDGVREKLKNPAAADVGVEVAGRLKDACRYGERRELSLDESRDVLARYEAEFDF